MQRDDYLVPRDLRRGRSLEAARELTQRLVLNFGQLLLAWPEMVEAARALRARGHRLARLL
jgi:hypothetical protein